MQRQRLISVSAVTVLISLTIIGACFSKLMEENPAGYCVSQKRYISDDEFIRAAVALYEWEWRAQQISYPEGDKSSRMERYPEVYQRWAKNKDSGKCCAVDREKSISMVNRALGRQEIYVYLNSGGDGPVPVRFDICGAALAAEFGYHPSTRNMAITTRNYTDYVR
jgi:Arc/MetJ-type ribon-helix-helix transcriptional regulator